MKKYIQPEMQVVEMETAPIMMPTSIAIYSDKETEEQGVSRRRGDRYSE